MTFFNVSNTLLSIFCRIFRRRYTEIFLKCSGEMTVIGKSHHIRNLRNVDFTLSYQSGSLIETDVSQELAGRHTGHLLQLTMQLGAAYAHLITHFLYIEVRIAQVLVHYLHDTLHQLLVVAFHLYLLHLVVLLQGTTELTLQATYIVDEIVYREMKFLQAERLCQISISS